MHGQLHEQIREQEAGNRGIDRKVRLKRWR